jgi:photosystem II stability/assembly factor-like uncharacterized protein
VAIDPSNPRIVYASSFSRRRTWWGYNGGGTDSALWKSTDGGNNWVKLDGPGWPKPKDGMYGRIAIAIFRANPRIVYAQLEAGASAGTGSGTTAEGGPAPANARGGPQGESTGPAGEAAAAPGGQGQTGQGGQGGQGGQRTPPPPPNPNGSGVFRSEDGGKTWKFMSNQNQRPTYFSQIRVDPVNDQKLFVGGTPAQMSLDGGKTWRGLTGSHTDYHAFWINPKDPRIVAVGHDGGLDISNDGGFSWDYHNDIAVGQFYQVSADMRHPYHVCGGLQDNNAWCGPSALRSTTGGANTDWYTVAGGDGFYTRQDPQDWAIIYGESQDGNMSRHDLRTATQKLIKPTVQTPAAGPSPNAVANENPTPANPENRNPTAGSAPAEAVQQANAQPAEQGGGQGGGGRRGGQRGGAAAQGGTAESGEAGAGAGGGFFGRGTPNVENAPEKVDTFRFYWNAPFEISPHNPAVIYMASQFFFKSTNRGDTWWMNPTDLTKHLNRWSPEMAIMGKPGDKPMVAKHDGYSSSSLATQVRESPSRPGVLWIGTDDGNLHVSQDGGETFTNVYDNIPNAPKGYVQISRIEPSHFDPATAYVALDAHRLDDWAPYLYKTTDYGKTWTNITCNLPALGNINALREDPVNPDLLFVGTEFGLFVSLDGAKTWKPFMNDLPNVRVDDILIHPRDHDLIIGTHGRSIWIMDDISPLEQIKSAGNKEIVLFEPRPAVLWKNDIQAQRHVANREFVARNPQGGTALDILSKTDIGKTKVEFLQNNKVVSTMDVDIKAGLNRFQWNMRGPVPPNAPRRNFGGGGGGNNGNPPEMVPEDPNEKPMTPEQIAAARAARAAEVPFVAASGFGGGGGGGGGFGFGTPQGPLLAAGSYMVKLTAGGQTLTTSVDVLDDVWMSEEK